MRWSAPALAAACLLDACSPCVIRAADEVPTLPSGVGDLSGAAADAFAPPDIPALTFLGAAPQAITRPGTLQDLAADIVSGVDAQGRVQQGLALEVSIAELRQTGIPLEEYRSSRRKFLWQNLRISFGTVRAAGDSGSTDAALAIRFPIFNKADPMTDAAYAEALGAVLLAGAPANPDDPPDLERIRSGKADLDATWKADHWNAARLELAVAVGSRLLDSKLGDGKLLGAAFWGTGAIPLNRWGHFLVHLRYDYRNDLPGSRESNDLTYGGRLLAGSPRFNLFGELLGITSFLSGDATLDAKEHTSGTWSLGAEYRLASGLWLSTGVGSRFEALQADSEHMALIAGLRWGIASDARLNPVLAGS